MENPIRKSYIHTIGDPESKEKGERAKSNTNFPQIVKEIEPLIPEALKTPCKRSIKKTTPRNITKKLIKPKSWIKILRTKGMWGRHIIF